MPRYFIVESVGIEADEKKKRFEGKFLFDYLTLLEEDPVYYYIRTGRELEEIPRLFAKSGCLYFMLSCHGRDGSISTALDDISFDDFSNIFADSLNNRRFFLSSCFAGRKEFAQALYHTNRDMTSFVASDEIVFFEHTYPLWTTFLYMIRAANCHPKKAKVENVNSHRIKAALAVCAKLYRTKMLYFWKKSDAPYHVQTDVFHSGEFDPEDLILLNRFACIPAK